MLKVLLIEDDMSVQSVLRKLLICFGYAVLTADDGRQGLRQYWKYQSSINIVLCDIEIPFLNGFQLLQQIRLSSSKLPPFAFIAAYVDDNILWKVAKARADCIIKKPVSQEMLKTILIALEMKHKLRSSIYA
ncbi:MAG: response regulator [Puniceicoccales bacterium]|jgi:CheY-like chemotaxis protein|nr:response regulator [Puniceicoccales bacterium]